LAGTNSNHGAVLRVADQLLVDSRHLGAFRSFEASIPLEAGFHPFGITKR